MIIVGSCHFGFGKARLHLANLIGKHLDKHTEEDSSEELREGLCLSNLMRESVILGGDFNSEPGTSLESLQVSCFLGSMQRVNLPRWTTTGLNGNFSKKIQIDHVYISQDLSVLKGSAKALGEPSNPWGGEAQVSGPALVSGASDHVPVVVAVWSDAKC